MNNRDTNIDKLKGFLIITVIIGHSGNNSFNNLIDVYLFHIPLFLASSIIFTKSFNRNVLINRSKQILIPYLIWNVSPPFFSIIYDPLKFIHNFSINIKSLIFGNWFYLQSILWFLPALFTSNILFSVYKFLILKFNSKLIFSTFLIVSLLLIYFTENISKLHQSGTIPFGIEIFFYLFPIYYTIEYMYVNKMRFNPFWNILIIILTYIFLIIFEPIKLNSGYAHRIDLAQFTVTSGFLMYLCFLVFLTSIFNLFINTQSIKILEIVGKYSFPIYFLHLIIYEKLYKIFPKSENYYLNNLATLIIIILTIFISIMISKFLIKISKKFKFIGMH